MELKTDAPPHEAVMVIHPRPFDIVFYDHGEESGKFWYDDIGWHFEGNACECAKQFVDMVTKHLDANT